MIQLPRRPAYASPFTPIAANLRCLAIAALCLCTLGCQSAAVHQRVHGLEGAENFRDFGGYITENGQQVKWDVLYRSNDLSRLTAEDVEHLNILGVATIMDFRSSEERQEAPTRWPGPTPNTQHLPIPVMPAGSASPTERGSAGQAPSAEQLNEMITNVYRIIPVEAAGQYRTMML
ncbi:MAG: tyrosine-protein phosphatase, partial [Gammaproteobacteria bacterium]